MTLTTKFGSLNMAAETFSTGVSSAMHSVLPPGTVKVSWFETDSTAADTSFSTVMDKATGAGKGNDGC